MDRGRMLILMVNCLSQGKGAGRQERDGKEVGEKRGIGTGIREEDLIL